jgi:hypothetical protein
VRPGLFSTLSRSSHSLVPHWMREGRLSIAADDGRNRHPLIHPMDLTDHQWSLVEPIFNEYLPQPTLAAPGRPPIHPRSILDAILWKIRTNAPWYYIPPTRPATAATASGSAIASSIASFRPSMLTSSSAAVSILSLPCAMPCPALVAGAPSPSSSRAAVSGSSSPLNCWIPGLSRRSHCGTALHCLGLDPARPYQTKTHLHSNLNILIFLHSVNIVDWLNPAPPKVGINANDS